jgi:DNA-binding MarR family transcriptional regulator
MLALMGVFETLRALRGFERRYLPFVKTLEDFDLLLEIGYHQEQGRSVTLKELLLAGIGSIATVQRRLSTLRQIGVVQMTRSKEDARTVELLLSPKVSKAYEQYAGLLERRMSSRHES